MFLHPPFHEGECAAQERVGVREKMRAVGQHAIRDFMPDQHREFFTRLPFVIVGTVDGQGQPWASVLANPPGFIQSPTPHELVICARPLTADPLVDTLVPRAPVCSSSISTLAACCIWQSLPKSFGRANHSKHSRARSACFASA